jgi:hypothetical protein
MKISDDGLFETPGKRGAKVRKYCEALTGKMKGLRDLRKKKLRRV